MINNACQADFINEAREEKVDCSLKTDQASWNHDVGTRDGTPSFSRGAFLALTARYEVLLCVSYGIGLVIALTPASLMRSKSHTARGSTGRTSHRCSQVPGCERPFHH